MQTEQRDFSLSLLFRLAELAEGMQGTEEESGILRQGYWPIVGALSLLPPLKLPKSQKIDCLWANSKWPSPLHAAMRRRRYIRCFVCAELVTGAIFVMIGLRLVLPADHLNDSILTPTMHLLEQRSAANRTTSYSLQNRLASAAEGRIESPARREEVAFRPVKTPVVHMNLYLFKEARKFIKHCEIDGINRSKYLRLVNDPFSTASGAQLKDWVWMGSLWTSMPRVCESFSNLIVKMQRIRRNQGLSTRWPIHMMDWSDEGAILLRCKQVENAMGKGYIYYHKRSMVVGRRWNKTAETIDVGRFQTWNDWGSYSAAPVQHIPICVRSDFVQAIESYARDQLHLQYTSEEGLMDALVRNLSRPIDVVHFWPSPKNVAAVDNRKRAQLRNAVSITLEELHFAYPHILAFAGLKGRAKDQGREQVQTDYLAAMLQSKIVVVAQKDGWEDHYRLFEALLSGALVLSDVMLSLPAGLQEGLLFYQNTDKLKEMIVYYLRNATKRRKIANRGRQVALTMHRSWHWMERVIHGKDMNDSK